MRECLELRAFGAVAYDAEFQPRNLGAQAFRRSQKEMQTLARVEAAHGENRELPGGRFRGVAGEQLAPAGEVDQFRNDAGRLSNPVELLKLPGGIAAGGHHEIGAAHVRGFAARLDGHGQPREAALEAHLVGDDALDGRDVREAGASGDPVAVHVEADDEVAVLSTGGCEAAR